MPTGVEHSIAGNADVLGASLECIELDDGVLDFIGVTDDAHQVTHDGLQVVVNRVGVFTIGCIQRSKGSVNGCLQVGFVNGNSCPTARVQVFSGTQTGTTTKDQQVRQ